MNNPFYFIDAIFSVTQQQSKCNTVGEGWLLEDLELYYNNRNKNLLV